MAAPTIVACKHICTVYTCALDAASVGEIANNRELEAQIVHYEREMANARELQAQETAKLEELANHVDLMHATLSKAANDLAAANNNTVAAMQDLETRR